MSPTDLCIILILCMFSVYVHRPSYVQYFGCMYIKFIHLRLKVHRIMNLFRI
jgi:hypothetical protein